MKRLLYTCAIIISTSSFAVAQEAPKFFSDTYPEHALGAAMAARGALFGEGATLDAKTLELIGIAVAAQIPCTYCSYAHTNKASALGASEAEIREAIAMAAYVRHWSTVLNGMQYDLEAFKAEYDELTGKTN